MGKLMLTKPGQWTDWHEAGVREKVTVYVKGDVFSGAVVVEREREGVAEQITEIRDKYQYTVGAPPYPVSDDDPEGAPSAWAADAKWRYRAGIPEGADWSGEASAVIEVGE